jgi:hypothetical protein
MFIGKDLDARWEPTRWEPTSAPSRGACHEIELGRARGMRVFRGRSDTEKWATCRQKFVTDHIRYPLSFLLF